MSILPLAISALAPDTNAIEPPVPSVLAPAINTTLPASVAASPTFKLIPPDALSALDPVFMTKVPEDPVLDVPVLI